MQTTSKLLVSLVLLSLLLTLGSGRARLYHRKSTGHSQVRDRDLAAGRLRPGRDRYPGHAPIRPSMMAAVDGDDDDDRERPRLEGMETHSWTDPCTDGARCGAAPLHRWRPLAAAVPLHQLFCLLLI
jgi:hypothetical protein